MISINPCYNLVGDLCRTSTYGVVSRDGVNAVVMIDYGLTSEVYDGFYK